MSTAFSIRKTVLARAASALAALLTLSQTIPARAGAGDPIYIAPENPDAPNHLVGGQQRTALVIGGGLAGLSAALELSDKGYRVSLHEGRPVLGGKLSTEELETGSGPFRVEHGLHMWFNNYHVFRDIRNRLGINDSFRPYNKVNFVFRNYEPEELYSSPAIYPFNLLGIIQRSPNLNLLDAMGQVRMLGDISFYNHKDVYKKFDNMTFGEWAKSRGVNTKFYDVIMHPAASVTLNDPEKISAAEMILYMHYYFIGQPNAMNREVTTTDHGTAVINPWERHLVANGVNIEKNHWVKGLRIENGRAVGEVGDDRNYDSVVLAADIKGSKAILKGSVAGDVESARALDTLTTQVDSLKIAPPYKIMRVWFDKAPLAIRPDIIECSTFKPITLLAQFHLLEEESAAWAQRTGGSVIEFHLYNVPEMKGFTNQQVWDRVRPVALEVLPEMQDAKVLGLTVGSYENFTSFEVGQGTIRPHSGSAREAGIKNLSLAGDWLHTAYPSALMERAVATGREAANHIFLDDGVRQTPFYAANPHGPGLFPVVRP